MSECYYIYDFTLLQLLNPRKFAKKKDYFMVTPEEVKRSSPTVQIFLSGKAFPLRADADGKDRDGDEEGPDADFDESDDDESEDEEGDVLRGQAAEVIQAHVTWHEVDPYDLRHTRYGFINIQSTCTWYAYITTAFPGLSGLSPKVKRNGSVYGHLLRHMQKPTDHSPSRTSCAIFLSTQFLKTPLSLWQHYGLGCLVGVNLPFGDPLLTLQ